MIDKPLGAVVRHADILGRYMYALGCSGESPWERLVWTEGVNCHLLCLGVWSREVINEKKEILANLFFSGSRGSRTPDPLLVRQML